MNQDVIYRALRGEASPEELEQVERWYMEDPEEFQRCADEAHLQIDMMELYGEQMRPTSWIVTHWKRVARMALQAAAMLAVGLLSEDMSAGNGPTSCSPNKPTHCRPRTANA